MARRNSQPTPEAVGHIAQNVETWAFHPYKDVPGGLKVKDHHTAAQVAQTEAITG
jgi:hypothetical protein